MSPFPETRISLILRLAASEDAQAWREFACLYAPAVYALAQRRVCKLRMRRILCKSCSWRWPRAGRWQPDAERARFRTWLHRVAMNLLADHFRTSMRRNEQVDHAVDTASVEADSSALVDEFEGEYRRAMFHRAAELSKNGSARRPGELLNWRRFTTCQLRQYLNS